MNEPRIKSEFFPDSENCGADLTSRPVKGPTIKMKKEALEVYNVQWKGDEDRQRIIIKRLDA